MESNNTMKKQFANETNTYYCIIGLFECKLSTKYGHIVSLPRNMSQHLKVTPNTHKL